MTIQENTGQRFTEEELNIAKSANLCEVAERAGYTPIRIGNLYTLKEHDSIRIHNQSTWYQWSTRKGGTTIDFLMQICDMKFREAVETLLTAQGYQRNEAYIPKMQQKQPVLEEKVRGELKLPEKAESYKRLYAYLIKSRGLSKDIVDYFVRKNLIYETADKHNIAFLTMNKGGEVHGAIVHGTYEFNGNTFKGNLANSDKNYSFHVSNSSEELFVFEAAIDMMSYMDMYGKRADYMTLASVSDTEMALYLKEHPQVKVIRFGLDNDKAGREAFEKLRDKYENLGYKVINESEKMREGCKDWNDQLKSIRSNARQVTSMSMAR